MRENVAAWPSTVYTAQGYPSILLLCNVCILIFLCIRHDNKHTGLGAALWRFFRLSVGFNKNQGSEEKKNNLCEH